MKQISFCLRIKIFILSIIIAIVFPLIILICFVPIYLIRYFASITKRIFRKDLGNLINARSAILAADKIYEKPLATLVILHVVEGVLNLENLQQGVEKYILQSYDKNGKSIHPELRQFPSKWAGFMVWKYEKSFSVTDHVKYYNGPLKFSQFDEIVTTQICQELVKKPFVPLRSPWEIIILPNYIIHDDTTPNIEKTAILLRIHHSLADGFSVFKMMNKLRKNREGEAELFWRNDRSKGISICYQVLHMLSFVFRAPYDLAVIMVLTYDPIGPWHLPQSKLSRDYSLGSNGVPIKLPLSFLNEIRDAHKVTSTGIIITAITGAMRAIMLASGKNIPENFSLLTALPMSGHPEKLRNHMTIGILSLPVGIAESLDRLRLIERNLKEIHNSTFPSLFFWFLKIFGSLYPSMGKILMKLNGPSAILSNFPGPRYETNILGLPILYLNFCGGMLQGIGFSSITYNGNLYLGMGVDTSILQEPLGSECTRLFTNHVLRELDNLKGV